MSAERLKNINLKKKCLILGGAGFLGSHLCEALLHYGHQVTVFDRPDISHTMLPMSASVNWYYGDIANQTDVQGAVQGIDCIFHLISTTLPKSSNDNPVYDIETNLVGTLRLLEEARKAKVRKIIFISSGGTVYGLPKEVPIRESHATDPICSYGISKLAIEKYLHLYWHLHGLDYCVLRIANPYGERQRHNSAQGAVAVFLYKALQGEEITVWGDGSVTRDYLYVGDAINAMVLAMDHDGIEKVFNIGGGKGYSLNQLLETIAHCTVRELRILYTEARPFDVQTNILDITRASKALGWVPQIAMDEGLERTSNWLKTTIR